MSKKWLLILIRATLLVIALCGICICGGLYPFLISLEGFQQLTSGIAWGQLIFYWGTSLPCFMILGLCWTVSSSLKAEVFTRRNAFLLNLCALLLFGDALVFYLGNFVLMLMGRNTFAIVFYLLVIAALAVALGFGVLAYFIRRGTELREENESYV